MILWFAGGACVLVWLVFSDPRIDYRIVVAGALLPDLPGRLTPLHSMTACIAVLVVVMLATRRGSPRRRRALALPIGMLLHLVLDGMWAQGDVFWWPFTDASFEQSLPSLERPLSWLLLQEFAGLLGLLWWRRQMVEARAA